MGALDKIDDRAMSLRDARIRSILAEARSNVAGHPNREERVRKTFEVARANVKRLASMKAAASPRERQLQADVAVMRQKRVQHALNAARNTIKRVAHLKTSPQVSEMVHGTTGTARVLPEIPSAGLRRKEVAPQSQADIDSLHERLEVLREAMPGVVAQLQAEFRRETDCLRREVNVAHRELDYLRRTLASD